MAKIDLPRNVHVVAGRYFYFRAKVDGEILKIEQNGKMVLPKLPHPLDANFKQEYDRIHYELLGFYPDDARVREGSVTDLVQKFKAWSEAEESIPRNSRNIRNRACDTLSGVLGEFLAVNVTTRVIQELYDGHKAPASSRNRLFDDVSRIFSWGKPRGFCTENPALGIERLKTNGGFEAWPMDALRTLIDGARQDVVEAALVAIYTGQDQADVLGMCDAEITDEIWDMQRRKIRHRVRQRNPVTLHGVVLAIIDGAREKKRQAGIVDPHRALLTNQITGEPWGLDEFRGVWRRERKRLEIDKRHLTFKAFRHTNATMIADAAAERGGSRSAVMARVADMLGHHSQGVTNLYVRRAAMKASNQESVTFLPDLTLDEDLE